MAVFTFDDRRFWLPIPVYFYVLPMRRTKVPRLLVQSELLSARTCAASDLQVINQAGSYSLSRLLATFPHVPCRLKHAADRFTVCCKQLLVKERNCNITTNGSGCSATGHKTVVLSCAQAPATSAFETPGANKYSTFVLACDL